MGDRYTGIEQEFLLTRTDTNTDITSKLGNLANISYSVDLGTEPRNSIGQGPTLQEAVDQAVSISVSIDCEPPTLEALEVVGSVTEDTETGTYTVTLDDKLPKMKAEIQVTETKTMVIEGIKFDGFELNAQNNGVLEVTFNEGSNGNATSAQLEDRTISTPEPDGKPESYLDINALIDNEAVESAESISISYSRNVQSRRGIQDKTGTDRRLPDEITEGSKEFSWSSTVEITGDLAFRKLFNQSSYPLQFEETSSQIPFKVQMSNTGGEIELTGGRVIDTGGELVNDDDVRTVDISGDALSATITGDTS